MDNQRRKPRSRSSAMQFVSAEPSSWNAAKQINFDSQITCITASAGLPLSWVDNAKWLAFVDEFIPAAKSPSHRVLTSWIIPNLASKLRPDTKAMVKGKLVTIQADDWTSQNHHHFIAFMIMADGKVRNNMNVILNISHTITVTHSSSTQCIK
jgi:hypothetical protein